MKDHSKKQTKQEEDKKKTAWADDAECRIVAQNLQQEASEEKKEIFYMQEKRK